LDIGAFYAGGLRGVYKNIMAKQISVEKGIFMPESEITMSSQIFEFKPQSRIERTEEGSKTDPNESCAVESEHNEDVDESFQILVVGHGPAAVRWVRTYSQFEQVPVDGTNKACNNETGINAVRFDGVGVHTKDHLESVVELSAKSTRVFTANKTVSLTDSGFTAVGVGYGESVVSQDAADRVAERVAQKRAELELAAFTPKTLSLGEGL
jgi:hypothetical protein